MCGEENFDVASEQELKCSWMYVVDIQDNLNDNNNTFGLIVHLPTAGPYRILMIPRLPS